MKKSLSILLLACMLLSMFAGMGFTLRSAAEELVMEPAPVAEEAAPEEDVSIEGTPAEEVPEEESVKEPATEEFAEMKASEEPAEVEETSEELFEDGGLLGEQYVTIAPQPPVAKIGEVEYTSVQEAIDAATNDVETTVTMVANSKENITVAKTKNITLDLNGYVLDGSGKADSVILISGILTIKDSAPEQKHAAPYVSLPAGGCITGGTGKSLGAGTYGGGVFNVGDLSLVGGSITGNTAVVSGGGVFNGKNFTMSGGEISGNTTEYGGGIYDQGTFTLSGGKISGNTAKSGGGISSHTSGTIAIFGGEITGNTAEVRGGGVSHFGKLTMTGGSITNNKSGSAEAGDYPGGGLYYWSEDVSSFVKLGGNVTITGNTTNGRAANLCLSGDDTCSTVEIIGALTGSDIGVTTMVNDVETPAAFTTNGAKTDLAYFTADSAKQYTTFVTDHLELVDYDCEQLIAKPETPKAPSTGDDSNVILWFCLLAFCGAATVLVSKKRREN